MDVTKLAALARLKLTKEEEESLAKEFEAILAYVDQIKNVEISGDFEESINLVNVLRDDDESNPTGAMTEKLLSLSPDREGNYIKVKKIL